MQVVLQVSYSPIYSRPNNCYTYYCYPITFFSCDSAVSTFHITCQVIHIEMLITVIEDVLIPLEKQSKSKETEFNEPSCDLVDTKIHQWDKV